MLKLKWEKIATIIMITAFTFFLVCIPKCVSHQEESAVNHPHKVIKCGIYQGIREVPKSFLEKKRREVLVVFDGDSNLTELRFRWFIQGYDEPLKVITKEVAIGDHICLTMTPGWIIKATKDG